ncbi:geranylgeranyl pyrophosphate synthase-like [Pieris brassicae]|uniref:geranylgeranyl pyrophosphate synthase-like n=1 Tax=Pieris brassicae TaxID=7116 RepID=UPI001E65E300|nr:geranylgeranyl pyrophosphate synthase-like [Pieris brassicae]
MSREENIPDLEEEILLPYSHIIQVKSKGIRNRIAEAFNHWLKIPNEKMKEIIDIMTMCHNGTLILDDIQDDIGVRRGIPAAHCVYGVPMASNTAINIIVLAMERCSKLGLEALKVFNEQILELVRGQGKEIYWRDMFVCPTEAEYRRMTEQKTGGMLNIAVRLMQTFSEDTNNYTDLGKKLGYYFQLIDDYCNIGQPEKLEERPSDKVLLDYYMDLTEGKFTIPIIHAIRTGKGESVLSILKQRPTNLELKRYCVSLLEGLGSLEYTRKIIRDFEAHLRSEIRRLGGNPLMDAVLDQYNV